VRDTPEGRVAELVADIEANYTERRPAGSQQWLVQERWTFRRRADAPSLGPGQMRSLNCPNCGSPGETWPDGRCRSCETLVDDGRIQWRVEDARLTGREPLPALALEPGGGVEAGTNLPTLQAPDLAVQLRTLQARDPAFTWPGFRDRVVETFTRVQAAWSSGRYAEVRPLESDFLFQQHRYWLERYAREGLRNRVESAQVREVMPVKVVLDAWVQAVTVRVYASALDWTEDRTGRVVGGSRSEPRVFSEYWTFVRSREAATRPARGDGLANCPSCGAPLDKVNETGVCGYCEAVVTGGDFQWVLSAIDQDEAWHG
jgi:hypothetical protein